MVLLCRDGEDRNDRVDSDDVSRAVDAGTDARTAWAPRSRRPRPESGVATCRERDRHILRPQTLPQDATTRLPGRTVITAEPTASAMPTASWPGCDLTTAPAHRPRGCAGGPSSHAVATSRLRSTIPAGQPHSLSHHPKTLTSRPAACVKTGIEHAGGRVADDVGRYERIGGVTETSGERPVRSGGLKGAIDLVDRDVAVENDGEATNEPSTTGTPSATPSNSPGVEINTFDVPAVRCRQPFPGSVACRSIR
jgi:hypothetical protein